MMPLTVPLDPAELHAVIRPRAEARPLPPRAYTDPNVLGWELEHFFADAWVCVGREEDAASPGDLFTATVGDESLLVARGEDGVLRAFFNVCQHRGTKLVEEDSRTGTDLLICPYHSWTYDLRGNLRAAERMRGARGFVKAASGLCQTPIDTFDGWIFINSSGRAQTLPQYLGNFPEHTSRYDAGSLRRAARHEYDVAANWKLLSENYQECYHCPTIHPELVQVTPYTSGRYEHSRGPWVGGPMELKPGCSTMSLSGVSDRPPIPGIPEEDRSLVFYYSLLPNIWISLHPDYAMTHTVWPLGVDRTRIVCEWLFHPSAMEVTGFDPADAVEFWDLVNAQDWRACERVQEGIGSRGFGGGRFSDQEDGVHALSALIACSYLHGRIVRADEVPFDLPLSETPTPR